MASTTRSGARLRRHQRIRRKIHGTAGRPRLNVFRSSAQIYAQIIDDEQGQTLASASTLDRGLRDEIGAMKPTEQAKAVGKALADRARAQGIEHVVFDRGGYPFHGRVAALAEGSREGGLIF